MTTPLSKPITKQLAKMRRSMLNKQLSKIKYSLISKREPGETAKDLNKKEYNSLNTFMKITVKEILKAAPDAMLQCVPPIMEPVLRLKTLRFIKENCPEYSKRLLKQYL